MSHDILLILIGAGVGLISSLSTSLFQAWLNRREDDYKRKREKQEALAQIQVASIRDVEKYGGATSPDTQAFPPAPAAYPAYEEVSNGGCLLTFIAVIVLIVGVPLLFVFKGNSLLISIIIGVMVFILFQLILLILRFTKG